MSVVWKYEIDPDTMAAQHSIPEGARVLDVQVQGDRPVMWWAVPDPPRPCVLRTFVVAPTGAPGYADNLHYVGTFQLGGFVGHLMSFEPIPREVAS